MHRVNKLAISILTLTLPTWALGAQVFEKADGSNLHFKDDQTNKNFVLKTGVPEAKFIALQTSPNGAISYALFSGRACNKCTETQVGIFMMRMDGKGKAFQFVYPGKITDTKRGQVVFTGRSFYGHCLPGMKQGFVTHQAEIVDRRRGLQKSVFTAEPGDAKVEERLIEKRLPSLTTTLGFVKTKSCTEIAGISRNVLKRPLDLTPREGLEDDEETDLNDVKAEAKDPQDPTDPGAVPEAPAAGS